MGKFIVHQLSVSGFDNNFSYVVINKEIEQGFVVDPAGDDQLIKDVLLNYIEKEGIVFGNILITHGHNDHSERTPEIVDFLMDYNVEDVSIVVHENCQLKFKAPNLKIVKVTDGECLTKLGVKVLFTPGHTFDAVCYLLDDQSAVFTGDTLFVDDIGFCEALEMYNSLRNKLWNLPDNCVVYSGHDYGHAKYCSMTEAKQKNLFFRESSKSFADFKEQLKKLI